MTNGILQCYRAPRETNVTSSFAIRQTLAKISGNNTPFNHTPRRFCVIFFSSPAHCSFKCHNGPATSSGTNRLTKHCIMFYSIIYMKWALCICTLNVCENVTRSHRCLHTYCCFGHYCCCCCLAAIMRIRDSHPIFIAIILGSHHNNRRTIQKRKKKKTKRHQPPSYYCYVSRSVLTLYSQYNHNSTLYFFVGVLSLSPRSSLGPPSSNATYLYYTILLSIVCSKQ